MKKIILSLSLPQLAGIIGALFTASSISNWYIYLVKPPFTPPNWLFGPVWLSLYFMMGIALYINWTKKTEQARYNVKLFFFHLFLNFIWTPIFFGARNLFLSLVVIIFLWSIIVLMIDEFWKSSKVSALLLFPYLLWVTYAAFLNYFLWRLN